MKIVQKWLPRLLGQSKLSKRFFGCSGAQCPPPLCVCFSFSSRLCIVSGSIFYDSSCICNAIQCVVHNFLLFYYIKCLLDVRFISCFCRPVFSSCFRFGVLCFNLLILPIPFTTCICFVVFSHISFVCRLLAVGCWPDSILISPLVIKIAIQRENIFICPLYHIFVWSSRHHSLCSASSNISIPSQQHRLETVSLVEKPPSVNMKQTELNTCVSRRRFHRCPPDDYRLCNQFPLSLCEIREHKSACTYEHLHAILL